MYRFRFILSANNTKANNIIELQQETNSFKAEKCDERKKLWNYVELKKLCP